MQRPPRQSPFPPPSARLTVALAAAVLAAAALAAGPPAQSPPRGPYLGQTPPGTAPQVFAPGFVSTPAHEFSCSFTPDGQELYFARRDQARKVPLIMFTRCVDGTWTEPTVAPFADDAMSFEPRVTPDGRRLYFQSGKPIPGASGPPMSVLYVDREGDHWGPAQIPGAPFNPAKAMYMSVALTGTIYTTDIGGGPGSEALATARPGDATLTRLGPPLSVGAGDMYPFVAPDESYIVFASRRLRPAGRHQLYVSHRQPDGTWGEPRLVDLGMDAGTPLVSPDGKYLFFTGGERGAGDIYWVEASVLGPPRAEPR